MNGGNDKTSDGSAHNPAADICGRESGKADDFSGNQIENGEPQLGQDGDGADHAVFGTVDGGQLYRLGHQGVSAGVKVLEPPEKSTVDTDQRREEKIGVEQADLRPQRVPF